MKKIIYIIGFWSVFTFSQQQTKYKLYRIEKGDTYRSIANKFNMSVDEFLKLNAYEKKDTLLTGVSVFVGKPKTNTSYKKKTYFHTVKPKETLYSIAKKHHLTVEKLKQLNGLKTNVITIGRRLRVR